MRKSQALVLTWNDIDFKAVEITITKSVDYPDGSGPKVTLPKTQAGGRTVPIVYMFIKPLKTAYRDSKSAWGYSRGTPNSSREEKSVPLGDGYWSVLCDGADSWRWQSADIVTGDAVIHPQSVLILGMEREQTENEAWRREAV